MSTSFMLILLVCMFYIIGISTLVFYAHLYRQVGPKVVDETNIVKSIATSTLMATFVIVMYYNIAR